jgi:uncharacterized membrane protein YphA (DoxX/SURF4 family)
MLKDGFLWMIRLLVGGLFIFSGLIKVNDPVGTSIKLNEYFDVFSNDIASFFFYFKSFALELAVFLVVVEVLLGVMLILGVKSRLTVWTLALMILFFTFLTFYSAYFNKVTDCGCFGDAIKLTPWESFYKDVILVVLIAILFVFQKDLPKSSPKWANVVTVVCFVSAIVLSVLAIRNLPFIDFRAYNVGVNIPQNMMPSSPLQYDYVMEKNGERFVFDQYPVDESLEFVEMNLKNPEALPKISDFAVWNDEGDFSEEVFSGNKLLILVSDLRKLDESNFDKIDILVRELKATSIEPIFIASASQQEITTINQARGWNILGLQADATVVKTIIRSNPGIMLLKDGVVLAKFHHNNTPEPNAVFDYYIK